MEDFGVHAITRKKLLMNTDGDSKLALPLTDGLTHTKKRIRCEAVIIPRTTGFKKNTIAKLFLIAPMPEAELNEPIMKMIAQADLIYNDTQASIDAYSKTPNGQGLSVDAMAMLYLLVKMEGKK